MSLININDRILSTFNHYYILPEFQEQILEVTSKELEALKQNNLKLNFNQISNFCDFFNMSIDDMVAKDYDPKSLTPIGAFNFKSLDDKYLENSGTYISTILTILDYIKDNYNEDIFALVCNKFNLNHTFLNDPANKVNLILLIDLVNFLKKYVSFSGLDFQAMAYRAYEKGKRGNLKKFIIDKGREEKDINQLLVQEIVLKQDNYDNNFNYSLIKKKKHFEIVGFLSKDIMNKNNMKDFLSKEIMTFKAQSVALFPLFFNLNKLSVFDHSEEIQKDLLIQKYYIHI